MYPCTLFQCLSFIAIMPRRRTEDSSAGSLDLLLDTICNTFGGVLFIAILAAILLQATHDKKQNHQEEEKPNQEQLTQLQLELDAALSELDSLRIAADIQAKQSKVLKADDERGDRDELDRTMADRNALALERVQLLQSMATRQTEINSIQAELDSLDFELTGKEQEVSDLKTGLKTEIKSRSRNAKLPQARRTLKQEVALIIRYGRIYFIYKTSRLGAIRELNTEEFVVIGEDVEYFSAIPKPYAGILIDESTEFRRKLNNALKHYESNRHYLAVGVWEDSFKEFANFKSAIVDAGFEYRLIPISKGGALVEGNIGTPLVQ